MCVHLCPTDSDVNGCLVTRVIMWNNDADCVIGVVRVNDASTLLQSLYTSPTNFAICLGGMFAVHVSDVAQGHAAFLISDLHYLRDLLAQALHKLNSFSRK